MKDIFRKISSKVSQIAGSASTFSLAFLIILAWAITGPLFDFSDTWQLVINTGTTIVTFLMVFLIQNTQNRDAKAMQLKLDELIRSGRARNSFMDAEDMSDAELAELDAEFKRVHEVHSPSPTMHKLHQRLSEARKQRQHMSDKLSSVLKKNTPEQ